MKKYYNERSYLGLAEEKIAFIELLCEESTIGKGNHLPAVNIKTKKFLTDNKTYTIALIEPCIYGKNEKNGYKIIKTDDLSLDKIISKQPTPKPIEINISNIMSVFNIYESEKLLLSMSYDMEQGLSEKALKELEQMKITMNVEEDNLIFKIYQDKKSKREDRIIVTDLKEIIEKAKLGEEETEKYIYSQITEPLLMTYNGVEISQNIISNQQSKVKTKKK